MKVAERIIDVDSTLTGEKVRMGLDENAVQHIIGVLTDLYSDQERAVIREYSTNALDANREAGNSAPIEVTTPTALAPFFRVKDAGIGLDAEDIRRIYSKYGASTKRDSDEQVGMLGLGAKSALTYTDQFTIVGTKNGRTVQVSVGRDEDGGGSMTIVSNEPSDAPNGVEIIVPVKRDNAFEEKAEEFFRFWEKGTVLLNGEEPANIRDTAEPTWLIPDELFVFNAQSQRYYNMEPGWVVMGNVAYPLPDDFLGGNSGRKFQVVAFVDIGEVNFTPSREALMLTKLTKGTLARIEQDVTRELAAAAQKEVSEAATPADAIRLTQRAAAMGVKTADITYKGRAVPDKLERTVKVGEYSEIHNTFLVLGQDNRTYRPRKNGERYHSIPPYGSDRIIFTGYTSKELTVTKRDKLAQWVSEQQISPTPRSYIFVDKLTADERFWLTGTPIYDWTPVSEIKLEKATTSTVGGYGRTRPRGSYELAYEMTATSILAEDIDTSKPILWVRPHERYNHRAREGKLPAGATLIVLPRNRETKFLRDFPTAMEFNDYVTKEAKDWLKAQDPKLVEIAKWQMSGSGDNLSGLDHTKVDDPDLAEAIRKSSDTSAREVQRGIEKRAHYLSGFSRYDLRQLAVNPLKNYPLLHDRYGLSLTKNAEHFYLYVNAAYAA